MHVINSLIKIPGLYKVACIICIVMAVIATALLSYLSFKSVVAVIIGIVVTLLILEGITALIDNFEKSLNDRYL